MRTRLVYVAAALALSGCGDDGGGGTDGGADIDAGNTPDPTAATCAVAAGGSSGPVTAPILEKTLPGSWDENWFAAPALVDITGDGLLDIVAARHSVLYVYDHAGTPLWQSAWNSSASNSPEHGSTRMWAGAVVGDFDGDGDAEIAVASDADGPDNTNVAVYDHLGELLSGWPQHFGGSDEVRSITAGDVDDDGALEVIVNKTSAGPTTAVYKLNGQMAPGWPQVSAACNPAPPAEECWDFGGYNQNVATGDVDGDGVLDVVSSYDAIGFGIFHGDGSPFPTHESFTDRVVTATEAYHDLALSQQGWGTGDRSEFTYSPPIIADIDADGDMEIVLAGDHESSESTDLQGVSLWVVNADLSRPAGWETPVDLGAPLPTDALGSNMVPTHPNPSVADFRDSPGLEILVPAYDGKLHAYAADGTQAWSYTFSTNGAASYTGASEALVADLNGDGTAEIIFTTYSSGAPREPDVPAHLIVLDANGAELHKIELFGRGSMAAPAIADLEGDGDLELVISLKDSLGGADGGVQIWSLPGSSSNCSLWATGRGNSLRQGYLPLAAGS